MAGEDETGDRLIERIRCNWAEEDATTTEIVIRLFRLHDMVWGRSRESAHKAGLTWGEFEALAALRSGGPPFQLRPGDIIGMMLVTSGGLTKILRSLETKGFVRRAGNEADGRSCFIELTRPGRTMIEKLTRSLRACSDTFIGSALDSGERARFLRLLEKLTRAAA